MADTAYETFKAAYARSKYLYRLHDGLTDHRQRAMRADWASNFCRVMHWTQASSTSIDRVDSPDAVIVLRENSRLQRADFAKDALCDLLRASLVMGVSALDAYFHAKVLAYIVRAANRGTSMPKKLKQCTINVEEFVAGKKYKRRMHIVRQAMERSLGFQSFQQPDKIEQGLSLIGVTSFWTNLAAGFAIPPDDLKAKLSKAVKRRNQIAHEGDLSQSKKARNSDRSIQPKEVRDTLVLIRQIAGRAEREINSQLP